MVVHSWDVHRPFPIGRWPEAVPHILCGSRLGLLDGIWNTAISLTNYNSIRHTFCLLQYLPGIITPELIIILVAHRRLCCHLAITANTDWAIIGSKEFYATWPKYAFYQMFCNTELPTNYTCSLELTDSWSEMTVFAKQGNRILACCSVCECLA